MQDFNYQVLIFYKYVTLSHPEKMRDQLLDICERLNIKGRIIVAEEGINGTVEGLEADTENFIKHLKDMTDFEDLRVKKSLGDGNGFPKLSVKVRPEIVASHFGEKVDPRILTGKYLNPEELHQWFEEKKEFYIVDMRNDYEYLSGYFESSVLSGMHNFYDLPEVLPKLEHLKNKTVVTVCTSGVRCEKASSFLLANGFNDVYQLLDGIQTYMEKYPNEHFKGKLYVFDGRLTLAFNIDDPKHEIVGRCLHCNAVCDSYVNCEYDVCHYHYICCKDCRDQETGLAFCKKECKEKFLVLNILQVT